MEKLYYTNLNNQSHFIHEHIPDQIRGIPYVFLNPIFDEKKRSQRFYAETARRISSQGSPVIRFDYYGTGDSDGHLYELNLKKNCIAIEELILEVKKKYSVDKVNLLGLRFGADSAIEVASNNPGIIQDLILIEPIVKGKTFLLEQRIRRKVFLKLNHMDSFEEQIKIHDEKYEDHQGFPISLDNLDFFKELDSTQVQIKNFSIVLLKLNTISSKKSIALLAKKLEENNIVKYIQYNCNDFWASLEPINTIDLSEKLAIEITNEGI